MPQDKFITRKKAGVFEMLDEGTDTRKSRKVVNMAEQKAKEKAYDNLMKAKSVPAAKRDPFSVGRAEAALKRAQSGVDADARGDRSASDTVARRDASNARTARERLATRRDAASAKSSGGGMMAKAAALGPVAEGAAAMYAADEATGFKRTKYSGNFGGPSFNSNPYAKTAAYPGQSKMSMMMGVGKKK
jgi:hypothetical protein